MSPEQTNTSIEVEIQENFKTVLDSMRSNNEKLMSLQPCSEEGRDYVLNILKNLGIDIDEDHFFTDVERQTELFLKINTEIQNNIDEIGEGIKEFRKKIRKALERNRERREKYRKTYNKDLLSQLETLLDQEQTLINKHVIDMITEVMVQRVDDLEKLERTFEIKDNKVTARYLKAKKHIAETKINLIKNDEFIGDSTEIDLINKIENFVGLMINFIFDNKEIRGFTSRIICEKYKEKIIGNNKGIESITILSKLLNITFNEKNIDRDLVIKWISEILIEEKDNILVGEDDFEVLKVITEIESNIFPDNYSSRDSYIKEISEILNSWKTDIVIKGDIFSDEGNMHSRLLKRGLVLKSTFEFNNKFPRKVFEKFSKVAEEILENITLDFIIKGKRGMDTLEEFLGITRFLDKGIDKSSYEIIGALLDEFLKKLDFEEFIFNQVQPDVTETINNIMRKVENIEKGRKNKNGCEVVKIWTRNIERTMYDLEKYF